MAIHLSSPQFDPNTVALLQVQQDRSRHRLKLLVQVSSGRDVLVVVHHVHVKSSRVLAPESVHHEKVNAVGRGDEAASFHPVAAAVVVQDHVVFDLGVVAFQVFTDGGVKVDVGFFRQLVDDQVNVGQFSVAFRAWKALKSVARHTAGTASAFASD